jgi:hypothetical protein
MLHFRGNTEHFCIVDNSIYANISERVTRRYCCGYANLPQCDVRTLCFMSVKFLLVLSLLTASILLCLLNFVNECMWSLLAIPRVFCVKGMDNIMEILDSRGIKLLLAAQKQG